MLRLAAVPESHPLHGTIQTVACRDVKQHRSPLHYLFHTFKIKPADYETIMSASRPPNCKDNLQTHVAANREDTHEEDLLDESEVCIYADGSGMDGKAAAVVVLYRRGTEVASLRYQLGPLAWHTTYEAEIAGVVLALQLVCKEETADTVWIRLDNQAVVQSLAGRKAKPMQSFLDNVHSLCDAWWREDRQQHKSISISWASGHNGVAGNEWADDEAKKAIGEGSSPSTDLPQILRGEELPCSLTAAGLAFKSDMFKRWRSLWKDSP